MNGGPNPASLVVSAQHSSKVMQIAVLRYVILYILAQLCASKLCSSIRNCVAVRKKSTLESLPFKTLLKARLLTLLHVSVTAGGDVAVGIVVAFLHYHIDGAYHFEDRLGKPREGVDCGRQLDRRNVGLEE